MDKTEIVEEVKEEVVEVGVKNINLLDALGYKASTQITKLVKTCGREDLQQFKPYRELTREQAIDILNTITPNLSDSGHNSKKERAMFFMSDVLKSEMTEQPIIAQANTESGNNQGVVDTKIAKQVMQQEIEIRKMKNVIQEQNTKIENMVQKLLSYGTEVKTIRRLLEIEKDIDLANEKKED